MRKIRIPDGVIKLIRSMHPLLKKKVKTSLKTILTNPSCGKALRDELTGLRSFKIGSFRIIYRDSDKEYIEVIAIGPRKRIYEETFRIIKKGTKLQPP